MSEETVKLPSEPQKNHSIRKLGTLLVEHKIGLIIVLVMGVLVSFLQVKAPLLVGDAIDYLIGAIKTKEVQQAFFFQLLMMILLTYIASAVIGYFQEFILNNITQTIIYKLRKRIQAKIKKLPLSYFDSSTLGDILSRVTNDVDVIATSLQQSLPNLVSSLLKLIMVLVSMLIISPKLTLIGLITLPLSAGMSILVMKGSRKYFRGQQKGMGEIGGYVEEMFTGHEVIRAFGQEANTIGHFDTINEDLYKNARRAQFVSGLVMPLSAFFSNLGYLAVVVFGGIQVVLNPASLSIGKLQAFIQLLRQFTQPIAQLSNMMNELQSTMAASERIFDFLEETEEIANPENPVVIDQPKGQVDLEHIRFGYNPESPLINDLTISFNSGDKIAIVGPTGAGKTTLVNLLLRFYDIQGGWILIDNVDIMDMRREDLRALFGMVLQDTWLFHGTIEENIRYGRLGASKEEVVQAAKSAHVHDFIRTLPDGYQMMIDEDGENISGGQRQLLTIARAILSDPKILILDEATSSVDTRTELMIQKAMENLMDGRTSFVIAHRLSTIRDSETILVLNNGDIVEAGNHETLLAKDGFYAQLYRSQLSGGSEL